MSVVVHANGFTNNVLSHQLVGFLWDNLYLLGNGGDESTRQWRKFGLHIAVGISRVSAGLM